MSTRTFSQASLEYLADLPPAKRGPGFRTVSVVSYSSSSSNESVEVPEDLESLQFLLFAGFDDAVAREIWQVWEERGTRPHDLIDDARHYIRVKSREQGFLGESDEDWDNALRGMGLSADLRRRFLDPAFKPIRLTQDASYWAIDTIDEAYIFVSTLGRRIDKKRAEISRTDSPDENKKPRPASRGKGQHRGTGSSSQSQDFSIPVVQTTIPPNQIDGRKFFFKGGTESRLSECLKDDGTVKLNILHSIPPTDFHPANQYVYLTKHHEVAVQYAEWARQRSPGAQAAILHIAISDDLCTKPREIHGQHWRDLIWNSRNRNVVYENDSDFPAHLEPYTREDVLVGAACRTSDDMITDLADSTELQQYVWKLKSGGKASQFVIQTNSAKRSISRDVSGFVWVIPWEDRSNVGSSAS